MEDLKYTVLVAANYSNARHLFETLAQAKRFAAAQRRQRIGVYVVHSDDPEEHEIPGTEYRP